MRGRARHGMSDMEWIRLREIHSPLGGPVNEVEVHRTEELVPTWRDFTSVDRHSSANASTDDTSNGSTASGGVMITFRIMGYLRV